MGWIKTRLDWIFPSNVNNETNFAERMKGMMEKMNEHLELSLIGTVLVIKEDGGEELKRVKKRISKKLDKMKKEAELKWETLKEEVPEKFDTAKLAAAEKLKRIRRRMRNKKVRPTFLTNGLPYDIRVTIDCKHVGTTSFYLKPNIGFFIQPLRYSNEATLSCKVEGYLNQDWNFEGNLRSMINLEELNTHCPFTSDTQQKTDIFLNKTEKDGRVEATLYSYLSVVNDTNLNVICEQVMPSLKTEILCPAKTDPPVFIRAVVREISFTVSDNPSDQSTNSRRLPIRFSITSPSGVGKLMKISVPSFDK